MIGFRGLFIMTSINGPQSKARGVITLKRTLADIYMTINQPSTKYQSVSGRGKMVLFTVEDDIVF